MGGGRRGLQSARADASPGRRLAAKPARGNESVGCGRGRPEPADDWTWKWAWDRGHFGQEACSRCGCGTVGPWGSGSVCAPMQLGVSATRALCRAKSPPYPETTSCLPGAPSQRGRGSPVTPGPAEDPRGCWRLSLA